MQQINVPPKPKEEVEIPLDDIVGAKVEKLKILQTQIITIENKENICEELETISSVIQDIHAMEEKEPRHFNELKFEYNNVKLLYQRYEIEEEISELNQISQNISRDLITLEEKQKDLKKEQEIFQNAQKQLEEQYKNAEEKNNNLVYNLLGFLTAFSIVSSVVAVVAEIEGTINIMIFMAFTILILLTTLIALHNFYKNDNKRETKLQDNYFLWKFVFSIIIILFIILGIKTITDDKENIISYLDNKVEKVVEKAFDEKLNYKEN